MKILFVCSAKSGSSCAPFIESQGKSLIKEGIELDYFTIKGKGIMGYLKSISFLRKKIKKDKYDLIHTHYALCGWVAILTFSGTPVIVSYMGSDVYGDVTVEGKRTLYVNIILAKMLQPFVQQIIVKSKNLESYIYLKNKVDIIPNGVDFERFKPMDKTACRKKLDLPIDIKLVLFLGNPDDPRKNINLLRNALALLRDRNYHLETPYPIKQKEVPFYLNAADVYVLTSLMEGSPNIVKEAMACNCPVVGTDVGDVREVIGQTEGCEITGFTPEDTAEQIKNAITFGKRTSGRTDIAHLDEKIIADKIISIYKKVL